MNKITVPIVTLLLLNLCFFEVFTAEYSQDPVDGGWLEEQDGVTILHVSGSHYDMGYQHGYLLQDRIIQNYRAIFNLDNGEIYSDILGLWNESIRYYIPDPYLQELQGLADGSGQSFEDVVVFCIGFATFLFGEECLELSAWGPATADHSLIHLRSYDIPIDCQDPVTGRYIQQNQILVIRKPDAEYISLYPTFAGDIFSKGGINNRGIAISCEASTSRDISLNATWFSCRLLNVLDQANSAEEAITIMNTSRQGSSNYIISDANIPIAYVYEETANFSYIGTWDDPVESTKPFWTLDHVIRRKNFYIHPTTALTQRSHYNPRIYLFLGLLPQHTNWFIPWRFYRTVSNEVESQLTNLDIDSILAILRSLYQGKSDHLLWFYELIGDDIFNACSQWASTPHNGDLIISFADDTHQAHNNQLHHFNLYELYESDPP